MNSTDTASSDTEHIKQSHPEEWATTEIGDHQLVIRDIPEGTVEVFVVSAVTRNVRTLAKADAVLFDGMVVEPFYDAQMGLVKMCHPMVGTVDRFFPGEWLDAPAVRLKRLRRTDAEEVLTYAE